MSNNTHMYNLKVKPLVSPGIQAVLVKHADQMWRSVENPLIIEQRVIRGSQCIRILDYKTLRLTISEQSKRGKSNVKDVIPENMNYQH
ncbi:hypothetical protein ACF0H5_003564 [Mactra antiquata]